MHQILKIELKTLFTWNKDIFHILGFSNLCVNGHVINKAKELKSDTSKLIKSLKCFIREGYDLATIFDSLWYIYNAKTWTLRCNN